MSRHIPPVAAQTQHAWSARNDPQQRFSANHGAPPVTATARPSIAVHPKELPPIERPAAPNTGNAKLDQKYQKQQDKLVAKQTRIGRNSSRSRTTNISSWRNRRPIRRERSKWSSNTSNRRSKCSKNTRSRCSRCSRAAAGWRRSPWRRWRTTLIEGSLSS